MTTKSTPRERSNATNSLKPFCSFTETLAVALGQLQQSVESRLGRKRCDLFAVSGISFGMRTEDTNDSLHPAIVQRGRPYQLASAADWRKCVRRRRLTEVS